MKNILLFIFTFISFSLFGQFRMVGTGSWSTVNDSTYTANITFASDLTGKGYLATQIDSGFQVFTPTEGMYRIDSVWNKTFSSASLRVIEMFGTNTAPFGQIEVFNPDGKLTVPDVPFGSTGATAQLNAAVVTWNARNGGAGIDSTIIRNDSVFAYSGGVENYTGLASIPVEYVGKVIYVDHDAPGSNTGSSWSNAYTDLQSALAAAVAGDEIWVAAGTYYPTATTDRTISFIMVEGVEIYGGFAGNESDKSLRDWETNETILSGDIGTPSVNTDNSYQIIRNFGNQLTAAAVLDGFTISDGYANGSSTNSKGAAVSNTGSSPTITNCVIKNNYSLLSGSFNVSNASSIVSNCTFTANTNRAAMTIVGGSVVVTNCIFDSNIGGFSGGAIEISGFATLTGCTFSNNSSTGLGGGIYISGSANVTDCSFFKNKASEGGAVYVGSYPKKTTFTNCQFKGNISITTSPTSGGGAVRLSNSFVEFTNCAFSGNRTDRPNAKGGAFSILNCVTNPVKFTNCSLGGNFLIAGGSSEGESIHATTSRLIIDNSILWGIADSVMAVVIDSVTINNSIVKGGWTGNGVNNLSTDPLFLNMPTGGDTTLTGNLSLFYNSPAIDAGNNSLNSTTTDIVGNLRKNSFLSGTNQIDIGAYELEYPVYYGDGNGIYSGDGDLAPGINYAIDGYSQDFAITSWDTTGGKTNRYGLSLRPNDGYLSSFNSVTGTSSLMEVSSFTDNARVRLRANGAAGGVNSYLNLNSADHSAYLGSNGNGFDDSYISIIGSDISITKGNPTFQEGNFMRYEHDHSAGIVTDRYIPDIGYVKTIVSDSLATVSAPDGNGIISQLPSGDVSINAVQNDLTITNLKKAEINTADSVKISAGVAEVRLTEKTVSPTNLVTNGTFDTGLSSWTPGVDVIWDSFTQSAQIGAINVNSSTLTQTIDMTGFTVDTKFRVTFDILTGSNVRFTVDGVELSGHTTIPGGTEIRQFEFIVEGAKDSIVIGFLVFSFSQSKVDDVSLVQVLSEDELNVTNAGVRADFLKSNALTNDYMLLMSRNNEVSEATFLQYFNTRLIMTGGYDVSSNLSNFSSGLNLYGSSAYATFSSHFGTYSSLGLRFKKGDATASSSVEHLFFRSEVDGSFSFGLDPASGADETTLFVNNYTKALRMPYYGVGTKEAADLTKTESPYAAVYATDGTLLEKPISELGGNAFYITEDNFSTFTPSGTPVENDIVFDTRRGTINRKNSGAGYTKMNTDNGELAKIDASFIDTSEPYDGDASLSNIFRFQATGAQTVATVNALSNLATQAIGEIFVIDLNNQSSSTCSFNFNTAGYKQWNGTTNFGNISLPAGDQRLLSFKVTEVSGTYVLVGLDPNVIAAAPVINISDGKYTPVVTSVNAADTILSVSPSFYSLGDSIMTLNVRFKVAVFASPGETNQNQFRFTLPSGVTKGYGAADDIIGTWTVRQYDTATPTSNFDEAVVRAYSAGGGNLGGEFEYKRNTGALTFPNNHFEISIECKFLAK